VLPVIPQLIIPIKTALNTRDESIMCITLQLVQKLVNSCDRAGEALVPYYRRAAGRGCCWPGAVAGLASRLVGGRQRLAAAACVHIQLNGRVLRVPPLLLRPVRPRPSPLAPCPFRRQLLPICNLYKSRNKNLGDGIDYGQKNCDCLGELIADTLALLEQKGGSDAFINIKYLVPTYESCINFA
jgi:hypothetical protein